MLDLLEPHLQDRDLPFLRLDGSTRDRGMVVQRFQEDEGTSVFLISLKAGGTGLNLTAADHVFLFDPWWNPAVEEQAFDRAHRIGQDKPVFVHRLVASGTVEERILALQEEKRSLTDMATGGSPSGLTREDLLRLIE
jgi:SNF2 family DNA or RNA helicase